MNPLLAFATVCLLAMAAFAGAGPNFDVVGIFAGYVVVGIATWLGGMSGLSLAAFLAIVIGTGVILTLLNYKLRRRLFGR